MIERNLGNIERVIRLTMGLGLVVWAFMQPALNLTEIFVIAVAVMLFFNGIFSRCYAWYILNINTADNEESTDCAPIA